MSSYAGKQSREHDPSAAVQAHTSMPGKSTLVEQILAPEVQQRGTGEQADSAVHAAASRGVATPSSPLPFAGSIQRAFGRHDISGVQAHTGSEAAASAREMGAEAYATANHVVLGGGTDLHTVAHEAAHVVQQRGGVQLKGGVGEAGDTYERHADAVADRVSAGQSAEALLDQVAGSGATSGAGATAPIQRLTINQAEHPHLIVAIDSDQYDAAVGAVDNMVTANSKAGLKYLSGALQVRGGGDRGAKRLAGYIDEKLTRWTVSEDKGQMGYFEKGRVVRAAMAGQPDVDPAVQQGLNMWVAGDPQRGINWNMIGKHLRGRLTEDDYANIGMLTALRQGDPTDDAAALRLSGRASLTAVRDDIRAALAALPDFQGKSYRISGVQSRAVYTGTITEGDLIKDTTFWSTSVVRGASGAGAGWGQDGTDDQPKAYFIIDGTGGKYIAKYSTVEGEQEVLFNDNAVFQVNRIVNEAGKGNTFFVYISQVAVAPAHAVIKNPFNGTTY
jgi:Domain of unknown function (DUF4157)/ADP-ribosyltransferase exoenzyme